MKWVHLHPRGRKKKFRGNLQGKYVSASSQHTKCIPPDRARVNFRIFLLGGGDLEAGVVHLVVLDRLLRTTTKMVVNFFEKVHPYPTPDNILATPMSTRHFT